MLKRDKISLEAYAYELAQKHRLQARYVFGKMAQFFLSYDRPQGLTVKEVKIWLVEQIAIELMALKESDCYTVEELRRFRDVITPEYMQALLFGDITHKAK